MAEPRCTVHAVFQQTPPFLPFAHDVGKKRRRCSHEITSNTEIEIVDTQRADYRHRWVGGLIIPRLARILVGPDNRYAMPASALLGALFLLTVDDIARSASSIEIPFGALTAILGAPVFLYRLAAGRRWEWL